MKQKIKRILEDDIEVSTIWIEIPMDEINQHTPPVPEKLVALFKSGDVWKIAVNIESGQIVGWPLGAGHLDLYCKPCDSGSYRLFGSDGKLVAELVHNYVPHGVVPGDYGDYIGLKIDATGRITNWPDKPDITQFFETEDD